ncbi:helix-turn-helix transcriptional regulator [Bacillus sp. FJAT-49711]|uniref:PadR family transcriptional regulator n=1 Tax=Bacillus sp. FJAT-49711 TaxID=2833585 RepID=UPI001BC98B5F|nr:PadR family transcriptional regulator [Bacillus sp. FJAT-49711]MBS4219830.1 helix-turn-helix transcriptional regulator [Bacillus sp. FJAT-49711]
MDKASPISSDLIRGHIDTIILRVLSEGDNYGYDIIKTIFEQSNGTFELKEPSLYTSLKRLEKQKFISAYWGDESQGGRRKYYKITDAGEMSYKEAVDLWLNAKELIDLLIVKRGENDE